MQLRSASVKTWSGGRSDARCIQDNDVAGMEGSRTMTAMWHAARTNRQSFRRHEDPCRLLNTPDKQ